MIDRNTNVQITDEALAFAKPMLAEVAVFNEDALLTMSERMQSNELDLIITSPPYFNARDYSQYKSVQDYLAQMKEIFTMAYDRLKESRMCVVNISPVLVEREKRSKQSYRIPLPFYFVPSNPAPFPEALAERVIKYYSYENDLVYDCFAGSGTVGRVCQKLKRRAILSELKTEYYAKMLDVNGW